MLDYTVMSSLGNTPQAMSYIIPCYKGYYTIME